MITFESGYFHSLGKRFRWIVQIRTAHQYLIFLLQIVGPLRKPNNKPSLKRSFIFIGVPDRVSFFTYGANNFVSSVLTIVLSVIR